LRRLRRNQPTQRPISWVDAKQPAIRLDVDWRPRPPVLESHESGMAADAARGAGSGALKGTAAGVGLLAENLECSGSSASACGLVYGALILLIPVFAVGGAVFGALAGAGESETMVNYYDLGAIESAGTLFEIAQRELDPPVLLQDQVILELNRINGISVTTNGTTAREENDILLNVSVLRYNLIGLREENPSVGLVLSGQTRVKASKTDAEFDCFWHYEGPERRLSELATADASLFKLDLKDAVEEIAEMNVANFERGRCRDEDLDQIAKSPYFLSALPPEELNELQAKLWWRAYLDPSNERFSTHLKGYTERHKLMLASNIAVNKAVVESVNFLHISKERVFVKITYAFGDIHRFSSTAHGTVLFEIERFGQIAGIVTHGEESAQRLKILIDKGELPPVVLTKVASKPKPRSPPNFLTEPRSIEFRHFDGYWRAKGNDWTVEMQIYGDRFKMKALCASGHRQFTGHGTIKSDGTFGSINLRPANQITPSFSGNLESTILFSTGWTCSRDELSFKRV